MARMSELERTVLDVLYRSPEHGNGVAQAIGRTMPRLLASGEIAVYPALHALEGQGFLVSYERPVNGKLRRYYRITESGMKLAEPAAPRPSFVLVRRPIQEVS